jgi:DNA repair protein RecO
MRPRYGTEALVLARSPLAEASALLYLLTNEFGLVKARAQGIRKPGAKLAGALQTLSESDVLLVKGKEGWRLSGAVLARNRFGELTPSARLRAGRIARLLLRLVHGETNDSALYDVLKQFLDALPGLDENEADAAECLAALYLLRTLGLDAGVIPGEEYPYGPVAIQEAITSRRALILRINHGITASGL